MTRDASDQFKKSNGASCARHHSQVSKTTSRRRRIVRTSKEGNQWSSTLPLDVSLDDAILLIQERQLVNVIQKRDDGWWFGVVVHDPTGDEEDEEEEKDKAVAQGGGEGEGEGEEAKLGDGSPTGSKSARGAPRLQRAFSDLVEEFNNSRPTSGSRMSERRYERDMRAHAEIGEENAGPYRLSTRKGWFPASLAGTPTAIQLHQYQKALGGSASVLDPPPEWTKEYDQHASAQLHELPKDGEEYARLELEFQETAYEADHRDIKRSDMPGVGETKVLKIERIENAQLWHSYAAKRQALLLRAEREGRDASQYERKYQFHGSTAIMPIYQQGFQRNFAGELSSFGGGVLVRHISTLNEWRDPGTALVQNPSLYL